VNPECKGVNNSVVLHLTSCFEESCGMRRSQTLDISRNNHLIWKILIPDFKKNYQQCPWGWLQLTSLSQFQYNVQRHPSHLQLVGYGQQLHNELAEQDTGFQNHHQPCNGIKNWSARCSITLAQLGQPLTQSFEKNNKVWGWFQVKIKAACKCKKESLTWIPHL